MLMNLLTHFRFTTEPPKNEATFLFVTNENPLTALDQNLFAFVDYRNYQTKSLTRTLSKKFDLSPVKMLSKSFEKSQTKMLIYHRWKSRQSSGFITNQSPVTSWNHSPTRIVFILDCRRFVFFHDPHIKIHLIFTPIIDTMELLIHFLYLSGFSVPAIVCCWTSRKCQRSRAFTCTLVFFFCFFLLTRRCRRSAAWLRPRSLSAEPRLREWANIDFILTKLSARHTHIYAQKPPCVHQTNLSFIKSN